MQKGAVRLHQRGEKRPLNQFFSSAKINKLIAVILTFEKFPIFGLVNPNFNSFCLILNFSNNNFMELNSVERNKNVMRFIVESNDAKKFYDYLDMVSEDFVGHHHLVPGDLRGNQSLSGFFYVTEEIAFPDGKHTIHNVFGEGDMVTLELSLVGTFTGPLPDGTPPNGKSIKFHYNILCRFEGEKLAELWWFPYDSHTLMLNLGMI